MVKSSFRRKMGVWGWSIWCHRDVPNNPHRGWPPRCNELSVLGRHLCWTTSTCHSRSALHCLLPALCPWRLTFVFGLWLSSANEKFQQEIKGKKEERMVNYSPSFLSVRPYPSSHFTQHKIAAPHMMVCSRWLLPSVFTQFFLPLCLWA